MGTLIMGAIIAAISILLVIINILILTIINTKAAIKNVIILDIILFIKSLILLNSYLYLVI